MSAPPEGKLAALRAALVLRLQTVPGVTVYGWPALTQALAPPAVTVGHPRSELGPTQATPLGPDAAVGRWRWVTEWPVTLHVHETNDATGAALVDTLTGQIIEAIRSDLTLGGEAIAAAITQARRPELNRPDSPVRLLAVEFLVLAHTETNTT